MELEEVEWVQARYEQLNLIEKKKDEGYLSWPVVSKENDESSCKKIQPKQFQKGELVLKRIPQNQQDLRGKWSPNWERPYAVKKAFSKGALILTEMDRKEFPSPIST